MKKTVYAISVLMLLLSCNGKEDTPGVIRDKTFLLKASVENPFSPSVKGSLQPTIVLKWESGDKMSVFDGQDNNYFSTFEGGDVAVFRGTLDRKADCLVALYPYSAGASFSDGSVRTTVPSTQPARVGTFNPEAAVSVGKTYTDSVGMYNIGGIVHFSLVNGGVSSVKFSGNSSEGIAGDVSVQIGDDGFPVSVSSASQKSVILTPSGNARNLTAGDYYFFALPSEFRNGYTVEFTRTSDSKTAVYSDLRPSSLNRAGFLEAGVVDLDLQWKDYVISDICVASVKGSSPSGVSPSAMAVAVQGSAVPGSSYTSLNTGSSSKIFYDPSILAVEESGSLSHGAWGIFRQKADGNRFALFSVALPSGAEARHEAAAAIADKAAAIISSGIPVFVAGDFVKSEQSASLDPFKGVLSFVGEGFYAAGNARNVTCSAGAPSVMNLEAQTGTESGIYVAPWSYSVPASFGDELPYFVSSANASVISGGGTYPVRSVATGETFGVFSPDLGDFVLDFYAVASGQDGVVEVSVSGGGDNVSDTRVNVRKNEDFDMSSPYLVDFTEENHYTFNLESLTSSSKVNIYAGSSPVLIAGLTMKRVNSSYPEVKSITTSPANTTAFLDGKSAVLAGRLVVIYGNLTKDFEAGFHWRLSGDSEYTAVTVPDLSDFSYRLDGLTPGTTYQYRAWARPKGGSESFGEWVEFTPTVQTSYVVTFDFGAAVITPPIAAHAAVSAPEGNTHVIRMDGVDYTFVIHSTKGTGYRLSSGLMLNYDYTGSDGDGWIKLPSIEGMSLKRISFLLCNTSAKYVNLASSLENATNLIGDKVSNLRVQAGSYAYMETGSSSPSDTFYMFATGRNFWFNYLTLEYE